MTILLFALALVFIVCAGVFTFFDTVAYFESPWPERTKRWYYKLPGGGFLARKRLGKAW